MKHRAVFVDASFLAAIADRDHAHHQASRECFERLLAEYEAGDTVLRSHAGMVAKVPADIARVLDVTPLRRWLRSEARRVVARHPELDRDRAAALVLVRRERIREVATLESWWRGAAVQTLPPISDQTVSELADLER